MPRLNVNGVDVYYQVYGEGAPILGIDGTPSSELLWVAPRGSWPNAAGA